MYMFRDLFSVYSQQGTILSAFFWGYMLTQVLGGFASDRIGGERVMLAACVLWSSVTLLTPIAILLSAYSSYGLYFVMLFRVMLGFSQGMKFVHFFFHEIFFVQFFLFFCFCFLHVYECLSC